MTLTTFKARRGTAAEWTAANPILGSGEQGFETDTGKFKFGNGSTNWVSLDYFVPLASILAAFAARVPTWQANHAYLAGELVTNGGILYQKNATGLSGATWSATGWTVIGGGSSTVADGSISTAKLADAAVTTVKLLDAAITAAKLNADFAKTLPIMVQYNGTAWPTYDVNPDRIRLFFSIGFPAAGVPTSYNVNDIWYDGAGV